MKTTGEEQATNAAPSRLHANEPGSEAVKSKRAPSAEPFGDGGCEVIVVSGGVTSAVTVTEAEPALCAASEARSSSVVVPLAFGVHVNVYGGANFVATSAPFAKSSTLPTPTSSEALPETVGDAVLSDGWGSVVSEVEPAILGGTGTANQTTYERRRTWLAEHGAAHAGI